MRAAAAQRVRRPSHTSPHGDRRVGLRIDLSIGAAGDQVTGAGPSANAALIRRAVEHLNATGDFDYSLYADDVSFRTRGEVEATGTFHGHDGLRQALARFREVWGEGIMLEVAEVLGTGDALAVVMRTRVRGVQSGVELEVEETWATWVRDGKIARIEQYGARDDALRAAGLI